MAAFLIKLHITATASQQTLSGGVVTTTVTPAVTRFSATVTAAMIGTGTTTIGDTSFFDDTGTAVAAGGLPGVPARGFVNVYVNGVLQQGGMVTSFTSTQLVLATDLIPENVPVVLEVVDTSNAGSSTITTEPTVSQAAITLNL